ncbi:glutamine--tRNA ligase/YqeY domain fusion protein [Paucibacter sp. XJ19-41]|uniref:glutamine--tRNA ligase/YqeY domain fusion protein n=1 Tax=Paucibacter sp. XJ19-41 TaxID=2927824 RepID=UPI00234A96B5|nr:glutamine--tRNA ligase/YqeY domain fusion protein [Paucibacter sp. XJ19-41]MDC6169218.1 glutamine--tRNA ligase/YqeY domain fusion protein [Paucibacter sp. XJ19-41]
MSQPTNDEALKPHNFLRAIIERDLEGQGQMQGERRFAGSPGDAQHHGAGPLDPAKIRTRFPPEPNGYLHVGHAKAICLNFGLARDYGGICHLRFDDTNPEKEEQEYVDAIKEMVAWLGWSWDAESEGKTTSHLFYASNYFDFMYRAAEHLITAGDAYVDEQTPEQMRANRGDFTTPGTNSPFRDRSPAENLARFREMRDGKHPDGAMVLRAKIDMASPNINLRDPALYRIRRATHHNTGDTWCIYPMYTYAHPIEDALERITHSICTLEFEDQRPFYDWLLEHLADGGLLARPLPRQYEFGRLNLSYVVTSKRKLRQLVEEGHVTGWDDPRMPTLVGMRRRGYTPESIRAMVDGSGTTKTNSWLDYSVLDGYLRADLEGKAARASVVLEPLKLKLTNFAEIFGSLEHREPCHAPAHPHLPELGQRDFSFGPELWVEREDFMEVPSKGYHRLFPGNKTRLKYGYVVECTGCEKDADGNITAVLASIVPDTKSGTPGADAIKVKGVITWVGAHEAVAAEVRLYDRLFTVPQPGAGDIDFITEINPNSCKIVQAYLEPSLAAVPAGTHFQFERHGYFITDSVDHQADKPVFNKVTGLRDGWGK